MSHGQSSSLSFLSARMMDPGYQVWNGRTTTIVEEDEEDDEVVVVPVGVVWGGGHAGHGWLVGEGLPNGKVNGGEVDSVRLNESTGSVVCEGLGNTLDEPLL